MNITNTCLVEAQTNGFLVRLSKEFYEQAAVFSAAYLFTDKNFVEIFPIENKYVGVFFKPKEECLLSDAESSAYSFINKVLDQQVRINIEKENGHIRDVIVEHAFLPVKKKTI